MNQITPPPKLEIIPENAPFSDAQRSWLNGFFAGCCQLDGPTPLSPEQGAALMPGAGDGDDGEAPWHDQTMPIDERMKLAEGRPLRRRMMAAMAQQDCGQCGYNCADYSDAIASKSEARLNLCVPGGKETARMLKKLHEELDKAPARRRPLPAAPAAALGARPPAEPGRSRDNPVAATFLSRRLLNKEGSEKETWHIEFDLSGSGLDYVVGDSFGIFAKNDLGHVDQIIAMLGASPHHRGARQDAARRADRRRLAVAGAGYACSSCCPIITGGAQREKARALAQGEDPGRRCRDARRDGGAAKILRRAAASGSVRRGAGAAAAAALFDLVVAQRHARQAVADGRLRALRRSASASGSASPRPFLPSASSPATSSRSMCRRRTASRLPDDPKTPIIMVGPGTGVAPFRAFLQDRKATGAPGQNWLFFGHQRSDAISSMRDELNAMKAAGLLTRLSLAWSRDGKEKFYVQDRMREVGRELWHGSPTARISISAAMPSAWRRTSSARWSTSSPSSARARRTRPSPSSPR